MKAKVLKPFKDIHTKKVYKRGQIIKIAEERLAEIKQNLGSGYIEAVPEKPPKQPSEDKTKSG